MRFDAHVKAFDKDNVSLFESFFLSKEHFLEVNVKSSPKNLFSHQGFKKQTDYSNS